MLRLCLQLKGEGGPLCPGEGSKATYARMSWQNHKPSKTKFGLKLRVYRENAI